MGKNIFSRHRAGALFALFLFFAAFGSGTASAAGGLPEYKEGEVLVKMKPQGGGMAAMCDSRNDMAGMAECLFVEKARKLNCQNTLPGMHALKLKPGDRVEDKVLELMCNPDVEYAQPNYIYHAAQTPGDADFSQQWGLLNTGQAVNYSKGGLTGADIRMTDAWDTATGSKGTIVAVIDTGIDYNHPDLKQNLWTNPSPGPENDLHGINVVPTYSGGSTSGDPMDDNGHGTHVSGIIGAAGNNTIGVVGVNWTASIMALKFLDSSGSGSDAGAIECIDYAVRMKKSGQNVRVINASWGGNPGGGVDAALENAIKSAGDNGILFVAAAGNESNNNDVKPEYPASSKQPNVISVAATDNRDLMASFSNFGSSTVDVAAPGVDILSTYPSGKGAYRFLSGTSMATPFVSGLAALVLAKQPALTAVQAKDLIISSTDNLGLPVRSGGRINAARALVNAGGGTKINLSVKQDGAYSVMSASLDAGYGKKVAFYRDGLPVGTALTGSAASANPGAAIKRVRETAAGTHTAYAVLFNTRSSSVQSDTATYAVNPPEITGVNPPRAPDGSVVTLAGNYFGSRRGNIYLTGADGRQGRATPLSWTDTAITFRLPGKRAGDYSVFTRNLTMASAPAALTIPPPSITALSPASAKAGSIVTVTGNYFGTRKGGVFLVPAGGGAAVKAAPQSWSDTSVTFTVPSRPAGGYKLSLTNSAGSSLQADFSIF